MDENPDVPLIDSALAREMFDVDAASAPELRSMLDDLVQDSEKRLGLLAAGCEGPPEDAVRELHQLRGSIGNFALSRASRRLGRLERDWAGLAPEQRAAGIVAAREDFAAGLAALRKAYPYLQAPRGQS